MACCDESVVRFDVSRDGVSDIPACHHPLKDVKRLLQCPPVEAGLDESAEGARIRSYAILQRMGYLSENALHYAGFKDAGRLPQCCAWGVMRDDGDEHV